MSLKYRLILLTVAVFAVTFGVGTLLGVHGARRLAEGQLRARLRRSAEALAQSAAPLNDEALARIAPLLDAHILVIRLGRDGHAEVMARSGGTWPWEELAAPCVTAPRVMAQKPTAGGRAYYVGQAVRRVVATDDFASVLLFAEADAVRQSTRTILRQSLSTLGITSVLLAIGMYVVGLALVGRINRFQRTVDATLPDPAPGTRPRGDELTRLSAAFNDLLGRLDRSRRRLASQQRLATTGKIASSVAHEVRNPLQAMRLTLQMIRDKCPPDARRGCDVLLGEVDRLGLLTDELLVLAGKDTRRVEPVDLARELRETLRLLQFQLRQREIETEIDLPALAPVRMDRSRCRQLFLNLLLNAAEASPRGGTVRVSARVLPEGVAVRIADNGPGFPEPVLTDQTEEFFSTKTAGAGLGLSICRRIVTEAGGKLRLYNTDAGAAAEVLLPADRQAPAPPTRQGPDRDSQ